MAKEQIINWLTKKFEQNQTRFFSAREMYDCLTIEKVKLPTWQNFCNDLTKLESQKRIDRIFTPAKKHNYEYRLKPDYEEIIAKLTKLHLLIEDIKKQDTSLSDMPLSYIANLILIDELRRKIK